MQRRLPTHPGSSPIETSAGSASAIAPHLRAVRANRPGPLPDDRQPMRATAPAPRREEAAPVESETAAYAYAPMPVNPQEKNAGQRKNNVRLHDLNFMDLYISLDADRPSFYQNVAPGTLTMEYHDLPRQYRADVGDLRQRIKDVLCDRQETGLDYDGIRLRVSKIHNTRGQDWVALRRIEERPPAITDLGFMESISQTLQELGKREGLVLICGATGQGKTTTAGAMMYDYLHRFGGVGFSIEDPVEYLIDGRQGKSGMCYQVEVHEEEDWAEYLKRSLRWHPRYIMVGELRTPEAANQLLRAANSGHLVITTMHAGSLEEGLEGLLHLAEQRIGEHASILLASGLTAVIHQYFTSHSVGMRLYLPENGNLGDPVRNLIRERKIGQMATFVDQQMARRDQAAMVLQAAKQGGNGK